MKNAILLIGMVALALSLHVLVFMGVYKVVKTAGEVVGCEVQY
jgi:hypothetical protein